MTRNCDKCRKCMYGVWCNVSEDGEMLSACTYILHNAARRPCPPGNECTVFEQKRRQQIVF